MADFDQFLPEWAKGIKDRDQSPDVPLRQNRQAVERNRQSVLHPLLSLLSADYTHEHALLVHDEEAPEGKLKANIHVDPQFARELVELLERRYQQVDNWQRVWGLPEDHFERHDKDLADCITLGRQIVDILETALQIFSQIGGDLRAINLILDAVKDYKGPPAHEQGESRDGEADQSSLERLHLQYVMLPYLMAATVWLLNATLSLRLSERVRNVLVSLTNRFEILVIYPKKERTRTLYNLNIVFAAHRGHPPQVARHLRCGFNLGESLSEDSVNFVRLSDSLRITTTHPDKVSSDGIPRGFPDERQKRLSAQILLVVPPSRSS